MQYHSSSNAYDGSYVKTTVDAWKTAQAPEALDARLITLEELLGLGYRHPNESDLERFGIDTSTLSEAELEELYASMNEAYIADANTPSWVYNSNYRYWTMSPYTGSASYVWDVDSGGGLRDFSAALFAQL